MITNNEWVSKLLLSDKRYAVPIMTHPGIDIIGKTVRDAVTNGEVHYRAIEALNKQYSSDAVTIIMDLTVEAEAFGASIKMPEHEVPTVLDRLVYDSDSVEALVVPSVETGRMPEYIKAARLAAENIKNKPVFAGCIGPVSLAGRLFDMSELMTALYIEPEVIEKLLVKCTDLIINYIKAFKETGVNGIVIAEPAAGLLSEDMCDEFSSKYVKRIVAETQDDNFMVILHNCGNKGHLTKSMVATGAKALHLGNAINMVEDLAEIPSNVLVMGNLDPVNVFKMAKAEEVYAITSSLLQNTKRYKNFIISSGCDTPPNVPAGNIDAFFKAIADFNKK